MHKPETLCWTEENRDRCANIMTYVQAGVAEDRIVELLDVPELAVKQSIAVYLASKGDSANELQLEGERLSQLRQSHMIERAKQLWRRTQDSELSEVQTTFLINLSQASVTGRKPQAEDFAEGGMAEFVAFAKRLSSILALEQEHIFLQIEENKIPHDTQSLKAERQKTQKSTSNITNKANKMITNAPSSAQGLLMSDEPTLHHLSDFVHAKVYLERFIEERQADLTVEVQRINAVKDVLAQPELEQTQFLLCALCELSACRLSHLTRKLDLRDRIQLLLDGIYNPESPLILRTVGRSLQVNNELAWIMSYADTDNDLAEIRDKGMIGAEEVRQREPTEQQLTRYQNLQTRQKILGELIPLLLNRKLPFSENEFTLFLQLATERTLLDRSTSSRFKDLGPSFQPLLPPSLVFDCVNNHAKTNEFSQSAMLVLDQYKQVLKAGPHYQGGPPSSEGKRIITQIEKMQARL